MNRNPILIVSIVLDLALPGQRRQIRHFAPRVFNPSQSIPKKRSASLTVLRTWSSALPIRSKSTVVVLEMLEAVCGAEKAKFDYYESRIEALEDDQRVRRADAVRNSRTSSTNTLMMIVTRQTLYFV